MKDPPISNPAGDPELDELICDCIEMLLSTLPPIQAEILQRVDIDGERPADVAYRLGSSASMIADQLGCGRQALKERLAEMSRICPEHGLDRCNCNLVKRPDH